MTSGSPGSPKGPSHETPVPVDAVENLLDAGGPVERACLLVETVYNLLDATAVALCRPIGAGWVRVAWAGESQALPSDAQVQAVVEGELAPEIPPHRLVLTAGSRIALALAEPRADDEALDVVHGLLLAFRLVTESDGIDGLDELPGPFGGTAA